MTIQETAKIMDVLADTYPQFYKNSAPAEQVRASRLWASMFTEEPVDLVSAAVKAFIATDEKGYPPSIGQIKMRIQRLKNPDPMTEIEAWGLVRRAIRRAAWHAAEEYERLPENIRRLVGSPSQLKAWAAVDEGEIETVIQSNFMRSYRARVAGDREFAALPSEIRQALTAFSAEMKRLPPSDSEKSTEAGRSALPEGMVDNVDPIHD